MVDVCKIVSMLLYVYAYKDLTTTVPLGMSCATETQTHCTGLLQGKDEVSGSINTVRSYLSGTLQLRLR